MSVDEHQDERSQSHRDERCTAPHPAKSFLYSLPAFALVVLAVVVLWMLLF